CRDCRRVHEAGAALRWRRTFGTTVGPFDRALPFLDPLLARAALVVERDHALGRAAHVRHDEADAGIKFSGMPLDLGDNPPRLGPGSGLIAEIGMEPAHMVRRSSDWAREQIADPALQNLVGR